jgi:hypothetical protein
MRSDGMKKSGTILSAKRIIRPLMTKENNPSVTNVIGIETSIKSGLIVWLITAKTNTTRSAVHVVLSVKATVENASGTPTLVI